jgi:glucose/mannose-6-phosphate isomerase
VSDPAAAIRAVDPSGQLDDVLALPEHLRDALWRFESAQIKPMEEASGLVVCGMGGSAVGGLLARAALGDRLTKPLIVVRDYELASWASQSDVALCCSYSGNTEETLACFEAADAVGMRRIVATTGGRLAEAARAAEDVPVVGVPSGLQPRAAVGYSFAIAAEAAAVAGAAPAIRTDIDGAAAWLEERTDDLLARAAEIAAQLEGAVPAIYGSDLTGAVAYRWKTQLNENAKWPAFSADLPEMDHNEIVGWGAGAEIGPFAAVFLSDSDQHPRQRERAELTAELIGPAAQAVVKVETEGETRAARLLWAVLLGDLVSLHVAAARGVDPEPVEAIDQLKGRLGDP